MGNKENSLWTNKAFIAFMAIICTALWGSATPAIKIGYDVFAIESGDIATKLVFAGIRFVLAGVLVLLFITVKDKKFPTVKKEHWLGISGLSIVQTTLQYIFFYIGLTYTTGAKGSLFSAVSGFIVVLVAPLVYKSEKLTYNKILGCLLAVIGLVLITMDGDVQELAGFKLIGEGFVIVSSLCNAVSFFLTKRLAKNVDAKTIAGWQLFIGGLLLLALGLVLGGKITFAMPSAYVIMMYLAVLSSVSYAIWSILLANNPVSSVSMYHLFTPIFGTALSGLLLNENILTWQNISALLLVSAGVWFVNAVLFTKKQQPISELPKTQ